MALTPELLRSILSFGCERPYDLFRFFFPEYELRKTRAFCQFQSVCQTMTALVYSLPNLCFQRMERTYFCRAAGEGFCPAERFASCSTFSFILTSIMELQEKHFTLPT